MVAKMLDGFEAYEGAPPRVVDSPLHRIPEEARIRSKFMGGACFVPMAAELRHRLSMKPPSGKMG
jgi:hypothetical protein